MRWMLAFFFFTGAGAFAQDPAAPTEPAAPSSAPVATPAPVPKAADLAKRPTTVAKAPVNRPVELLKCIPATSNEETKAREAAEASNLSDHEVLARLIFSESLATGYFTKKCDAPSGEALMEALGWLIMNRVNRYSPKRDDPKPDAFFHTIFERGQFSTSFSPKKNNIYSRFFLCPFEAQKHFDEAKAEIEAWEIYQKARTVASRVMDQYIQSGVQPKYSKIRNTYFPYSEFNGQKRPEWAPNPDPTKNKGYVRLLEGEKPCAEFYRR